MSRPKEATLFDSLPDEPVVLTVSQLTAQVKRALSEAIDAPIHVVGEISNFKRHRSGHLYFTMKDPRCELACVMWRSAAGYLKFDPADGMQIIASGEIDVFERTGRYQLYVRKLQVQGTGALELAFRQLYQRLHAEGLFDKRFKKAIPAHPGHLAVVTSPSGAAFRDIIQVIRRRYPCVTVSLVPVSVQGETAAREIARAINWINRQRGALGGIDVLIVGRGGGSLEDLWAFNEEIVARAIFDSDIPVISAVGHEVDTTISDLVADLRAPTPTAAAELAVPVRSELIEQLGTLSQRMSRALGSRMSSAKASVEALARREPLRVPLRVAGMRGQWLDLLHNRLSESLQRVVRRREKRVARCEASVQSVEPRFLIASFRTRLSNAVHGLRLAVDRRIQAGERCVVTFGEALGRISPAGRISLIKGKLQTYAYRLESSTRRRTDACEKSLSRFETQLQSVGYQRTLARGYTVTRRVDDTALIKSSLDVATGDVVRTETAEGQFESRVT